MASQNCHQPLLHLWGLRIWAALANEITGKVLQTICRVSLICIDDDLSSTWGDEIPSIVSMLNSMPHLRGRGEDMLHCRALGVSKSGTCPLIELSRYGDQGRGERDKSDQVFAQKCRIIEEDDHSLSICIT
ncbi:hypothetical protein FEM48_Zijuj04G0120100 [Ziziphus jujuba var. spinosa]|uniref:Uncharacterized protein n=1 Tax=Ziziphus jujuba var. spinosa TaxID=714518 RepID=A0A978VJR7_ZIZJJ|nr:hypothetical protein FEM48_Zijuj04G0120100 [Ziziphus jujuba var. spinosa]